VELGGGGVVVVGFGVKVPGCRGSGIVPLGASIGMVFIQTKSLDTKELVIRSTVRAHIMALLVRKHDDGAAPSFARVECPEPVAAVSEVDLFCESRAVDWEV
jgi:hypothetical protein